MKIDHILKLARVEIKGGEKSSIEKDFSSILGFVKKIEKLDTKKTKPMSYPVDIYNAMREDKIQNKKGSNKKLVDAAPETKDNLIKVKEILK
jgi:aspartyl/glutamyl-tRNA(Asn/Gln) amidotransferase C subunit